MSPNIVFLDIETSPIIGYTWGFYDQNVIKVIEPVKVLCCGWKTLGTGTVTVKGLNDYEGYQPGVVDDKKLVEEIWYVLDEADVVLAHNGDSFDIKVLNARFLANGLNPPSDYKTIDTLKVAKKYFRFNNNKLDELGSYLHEGRKAGTGGFETWTGCMEGDPTSWKRMKEYNAKDVELLERVYLRLRPFISNHPDLNLLSGTRTRSSSFSCGTCQSENTQKRGFQMTKAGRYQRYSCSDCGSWSSGPYEKVK